MTFLITPFFGKDKMLAEFLKFLYRDPPSCVHIITNNHYPLPGDGPNIEQLAKYYGCRYVDSGGDVGLHNSLNHAIDVCGIGDNDILIGCDADDRPTPGFVSAIEKVMQAESNLAVLALNFWVIDQRRKEIPDGYDHIEIAGEPVAINKSVEMWNVAGFNMGFIKAINGFNQPNRYYGGIEIDLYQKWQKKNLALGYLLNYRSDIEPVDRLNQDLFDPEYSKWKIAHAVHGFTGSFAEYLSQKV